MYKIIIQDKMKNYEFESGEIETAGEVREILQVLNKVSMFGSAKRFCIWVYDIENDTAELGSNDANAMY